MNVAVFYNQILEEIRVDEKALEEKKTLAHLLKKRVDSLPATAEIHATTASPQVSMNAASDGSKSFVRLVEDAVKALSGIEFVVSDVAQAMRNQSVALPEKPNPKIATVLARLQESGILARTFTGGGNVPNRYRNSSDPEVAAQGSNASA